MSWSDPSLSLRWGPYTKLDGQEQQLVVTAAISAKKAGLVTMRTAVEKIAGIFGIENVDAALVALETERDENAKRALDQQATLEHAMNKLADGSETPPG